MIPVYPFIHNSHLPGDQEYPSISPSHIRDPISPFDPPAPHEFRLGAPHPWIPCNPCCVTVTVWPCDGWPCDGCGASRAVKVAAAEREQLGSTWWIEWDFSEIRKSLIVRNPSQMFPSWAPILHPTKKKTHTLGVRNSIYNLMMMVSEIPNLKSWDDSPFSTRQGADSQRQCHVTSCVWVKSPHGLTTPDSVWHWNLEKRPLQFQSFIAIYSFLFSWMWSAPRFCFALTLVALTLVESPCLMRKSFTNGYKSRIFPWRCHTGIWGGLKIWNFKAATVPFFIMFRFKIGINGGKSIILRQTWRFVAALHLNTCVPKGV